MMLNKLKITNYNQISKLFWPIAFTMILTNTLSFVDTFMISNYSILGPAAILGATQILFIFGPIFFAMMTGVNIYTVQYYSRNEYGRLKHLGGILLTMSLSLSILVFIFLTFFDEQVVRFFTSSNEVYNMSIQYMEVYKYAILLMPLDMFFTYQYRAIKKPKIPLITGTLQASMNIFFNIILIYGFWIFPELGIKGAAIGTLLSRMIIIVVQYIIAKKLQVPFLGTFNEMFSYEGKFFKEVFKNTIPLMVVEFGFGLTNIIYYKMYITTSAIEISAYSISKTISYTINAFVIATANVNGIISGTLISSGISQSSKEFKETMGNLFKFMSYNSIAIILISIFILPLFIPLFLMDQSNVQVQTNYWEIVKLIYILVVINGLWMAIRVFSSSIISILKSGNDNKYVMWIDAGSSYIFAVPFTLLLVIFFEPSIVILRSTLLIEIVIKLFFGIKRYKKMKWVKKI